MLQINYTIVIICSTILYTIAIHLLNWGLRSTKGIVNPEAFGFTMIILHIIALWFYLGVILYPLAAHL